MSAATEELYSLLIPLADDRLIVPRACVAEVVRFSRPEHEAGAHDWMIGTKSMTTLHQDTQEKANVKKLGIACNHFAYLRQTTTAEQLTTWLRS